MIASGTLPLHTCLEQLVQGSLQHGTLVVVARDADDMCAWVTKCIGKLQKSVFICSTRFHPCIHMSTTPVAHRLSLQLVAAMQISHSRNHGCGFLNSMHCQCS